MIETHFPPPKYTRDLSARCEASLWPEIFTNDTWKRMEIAELRGVADIEKKPQKLFLTMAFLFLLAFGAGCSELQSRPAKKEDGSSTDEVSHASNNVSTACPLKVTTPGEMALCLGIENDQKWRRLSTSEIAIWLPGLQLSIQNSDVVPGHGIVSESFACDGAWRARGSTTLIAGSFEIDEEGYCVRSNRAVACAVIYRDASGALRRLIKQDKAPLEVQLIAIEADNRSRCERKGF